MIINKLEIFEVFIVVCTDLYSFYECFVKLGTIKEKRLMIDIIAFKQSYERRELAKVKWIKRKDNLTDFITKINSNKSLATFVNTNKANVRVERIAIAIATIAIAKEKIASRSPRTREPGDPKNPLTLRKLSRMPPTRIPVPAYQVQGQNRAFTPVLARVTPGTMSADDPMATSDPSYQENPLPIFVADNFPFLLSCSDIASIVVLWGYAEHATAYLKDVEAKLSGLLTDGYEDNQALRGQLLDLQGQIITLDTEKALLASQIITLEALQRNLSPLSNRPHRSAEHPDPDKFDGTIIKLRPFLTDMSIKLAVNRDWYPTEYDKMAYFLSRLSGEAKGQVKGGTSIRGEILYKSVSEIIDILDAAFGDINAKSTAQQALFVLTVTVSAILQIALGYTASIPTLTITQGGTAIDVSVMEMSPVATWTAADASAKRIPKTLNEKEAKKLRLPYRPMEHQRRKGPRKSLVSDRRRRRRPYKKSTLIISSLDTPIGNHLVLPCIVTDLINEIPIKTKAMVDCGCTGKVMINYSFAQTHNLILEPLLKPRSLRLADGSLSSANVTYKTQLHLNINGHSELITGFLSNLGKYDIILGKPWLAFHNPQIDWSSDSLTFNSRTCKNHCLPLTCHQLFVRGSTPLVTTFETLVKGPLPRRLDIVDDIQPSELQQRHMAADMYLCGASLKDIRKALAPKAHEANKLAPYRDCDHAIELKPGAILPHGPFYNMSQDELLVLRKFLKENLDKGFIRASTSQAASLVLFAKKPGGGLRFCVDYRALNAITIKNRYPLPFVQETFSRLSKAKYFTKLDVIYAFNRIRMRDSDEWLTAFNTRYGLFESFVMPFGVKMDPAKVDCITFWEAPVNVKDVQAFLGFSNFYRRFIKEAFVSAPILSHFDPDREIWLETDASDYVSFAILSQKDDKGELHPVAYMSRKYDAAECNYEIYDKELLAIVRAFESWRSDFTRSSYLIYVLTDHRNLEYFMTTKQLTRRQVRWSEFLSEFDFIIKFRPRKEGRKPDSLTRRSQDLPQDDSDPRHTYRNQAFFSTDNLDPQISNSLTPTSSPNAFAQLDFFSELTSAELHTEVALCLDELALADELQNLKIMRFLKEGYKSDKWFKVISKEMTKEEGIPHSKEIALSECILRDDRLFFRGRLYVPDTELRTFFLQSAHDSCESGHPGKNALYEVISRDYWWPNVSASCARFVRNCDSCSRNTTSRLRYQGTLKPFPFPDQRWRHLSVDFVGPLPLSNGYDCVMVVVDRFSKGRHLIACYTKLKAKELAQLFLDNVWKLHGLPDTIATWLSMAEFSANNVMNASTQMSPFFANTGFHPRVSFGPPRPLEPTFTPAIQAGNKAGTAFVNKMEQILALFKTNLISAQATQEFAANKTRSSALAYRVRDEVFLDSRNIKTDRPIKKFDHKFFGRYKIKEVLGSYTYRLDLPFEHDKLNDSFHTNLLRPAPTDPLPGQQNPPPPPIAIDANGEKL
ncbi:retrotransposon nucleocapsid protein [Drepanopeziza brunnea f. sp. 'multigermtubi' MB_m1]|uniref:RNA-directed DNA polymerase n=1 Tax=Marssonina brunnea f. sp. multigermtubi (strain MB_m1) TaxID=1072389 RepID=K1WXQ9_MARBU|nr:retrotransposon nucleocapsid protein [Drepanopeziza brunnea f. sp. 'multigermtubi' MB_m1]EKD17831.1 retrotransposon nucleocapsid protein [Drepanopeziza brunnea f. sp. 'multigermtubi' MB_m1]